MPRPFGTLEDFCRLNSRAVERSVLRGIGSPAGAERRSFEVLGRLLTSLRGACLHGAGFLLDGLSEEGMGGVCAAATMAESCTLPQRDKTPVSGGHASSRAPVEVGGPRVTQWPSSSPLFPVFLFSLRKKLLRGPLPLSVQVFRPSLPSPRLSHSYTDRN